MISAEKIRNKIQECKDIQEEIKRAEEQKKKQDKINEELLEVEKAINEFDSLIGKDGFDLDSFKYIIVPILVGKDVMTILQKEGYYVKLDIHGRKTYLYFNNERWMGTLDVGDSIAVPCKDSLTTANNKTNLKTELHNSKVEDECTVTKDEDEIDKFWNEFINNSNWKVYRINQTSKC